MNDICKLTIVEARKLLDEKKLSSVELTTAYLDNIGEKDSIIMAFLKTMNESALEQSKKADEKILAGDSNALCGIPLGIKDNIMVEGFSATAGSRMLENYKAPYDATVIRFLESVNTIILGKTNCDEFAMGSSTENSAFGATKNPRDLSKVPGGSSGGSAAAVAADECSFALGSDTGGSIRQPASFCGVVGFKPSYGRVSRYGLIAMASSFDQIGPLTKTVEDSAIVFDAISGRDRRDATTVGPERIPFMRSKYTNTTEYLKDFDIKKITIGVPREFFEEGLDAEVKSTVQKAIDKLESEGAQIKEVSLPSFKYSLAVYYIVLPCEVSANLARFDGIKYGFSKSGEESTLEDVYMKSRHTGFGAEVRRRIMLGAYALSAGYYDAYYLRAQKVRTKLVEDFKKVFENVDVLMGPVAPTTAFGLGEKVGNPLQMYLSDIYTVPVNLAGLPALSVPVGEAGGLPVGVQIIGPQFYDENVLQVGHFYEKIK